MSAFKLWRALMTFRDPPGDPVGAGHPALGGYCHPAQADSGGMDGFPSRSHTVVYLGALANALLLVGDFATGTSAKPVNAAILAVGYVLLTVWFAVVGVKMLRSKPARGPVGG